MVKSRRLFLITLVLLGLLLSTTVAIAGCGGDTTTTAAATSATTVAKDSAKVIGDRALKVFSSNQIGGDYGANAISGANLAKKLNDPAEKDKLFVLDVRKKADYDKGHIAGATQVEFAQWAAPDNLSKLPKDKKIIVVCYTGNTAAQVTAGLRMLGFDAATLTAGMNGWVKTDATDGVITELSGAPNPVVTTPAGASSPAPPATTFEKPSDADYKVLAEKANMIMGKMPTDGDYSLNTIKAADLSAKLAGADKDKLFVLDIRKTNDFNKGHIDSATHIDYAALALPDNLKMLPKDKKIIVVCYTGNTAAQAVTILRMLDYDAVNFKFGMMGWDGGGKDEYIQDIQSAACPVVTG